jgi:hypothetical protein
MGHTLVSGMADLDINIGSVSAVGYIGDGIQQTDANVHITVTTEGNLKMEGSRRAAANEVLIAELDSHQQRALRDALEGALER